MVLVSEFFLWITLFFKSLPTVALACSKGVKSGLFAASIGVGTVKINMSELNKDLVSEENDILLDSRYPKTNQMPDNHWGLKPSI